MSSRSGTEKRQRNHLVATRLSDSEFAMLRRLHRRHGTTTNGTLLRLALYRLDEEAVPEPVPDYCEAHGLPTPCVWCNS